VKFLFLSTPSSTAFFNAVFSFIPNIPLIAPPIRPEPADTIAPAIGLTLLIAPPNYPPILLTIEPAVVLLPPLKALFNIPPTTLPAIPSPAPAKELGALAEPIIIENLLFYGPIAVFNPFTVPLTLVFYFYCFATSFIDICVGAVESGEV